MLCRVERVCCSGYGTMCVVVHAKFRPNSAIWPNCTYLVERFVICVTRYELNQLDIQYDNVRNRHFLRGVIGILWTILVSPTSENWGGIFLFVRDGPNGPGSHRVQLYLGDPILAPTLFAHIQIPLDDIKRQSTPKMMHKSQIGFIFLGLVIPSEWYLGL